VVADYHHFDEEQDPDPHLNEKKVKRREQFFLWNCRTHLSSIFYGVRRHEKETYSAAFFKKNLSFFWPNKYLSRDLLFLKGRDLFPFPFPVP
jgi:hypothetical protein